MGRGVPQRTQLRSPGGLATPHAGLVQRLGGRFRLGRGAFALNEKAAIHAGHGPFEQIGAAGGTLGRRRGRCRHRRGRNARTVAARGAAGRDRCNLDPLRTGSRRGYSKGLLAGRVGALDSLARGAVGYLRLFAAMRTTNNLWHGALTLRPSRKRKRRSGVGPRLRFRLRRFTFSFGPSRKRKRRSGVGPRLRFRLRRFTFSFGPSRKRKRRSGVGPRLRFRLRRFTFSFGPSRKR